MNLNGISSRSAAAAILVLLILAVPASAAGTWATEAISATVPEPIAADISGSYVVYSVAYGKAMNLSAPRGLLLYDADNGKTVSLANASGKMTLTGGQIAGDAVVWFEEPEALLSDPAGLNNSILLFSPATGTMATIRSSPSAEWPKTDGSRVVWSETPGDTYIASLSLYDIAKKTTETLPVHPMDGSSVALEGDTIAFRDVNISVLTLYDIPSQTSTAVMVPVHTNATDTMVDAYAMGGDVLLYKSRIIELLPKRSISSTLTWYSITEQTNVTLSPITGLPVENLTADERNAAFGSLFTDGKTISWVLETGISESDVITVNAETGAVSHLKIDGDVAFPAVDGDRAVWVQSKLMADSHVVLATWQDTVKGEDAATPVPETTAAPGCGVFCAAGALAVGAFARKK